MPRVRVKLSGVVQGVGFRPFVLRSARALELAGHVQNTSGGVCAEVEGPEPAIAAFIEQLRHGAPAAARISQLELEPIAPTGDAGFEIRESSEGGAELGLVPDRALCADCRAELRNPADRRYRYPFNSCALCGPRFSITWAVPYDRERTSMRAFPLCGSCRREYDDPSDRRCHAQGISCPQCGPQLWACDAGGHELARGDGALAHALAVLERGGVVALKGQTGFQLVTAADQGPAVARLRARKRRPYKPLALMLRDLAAAAELVELEPAAASSLQASEGPIVILPRRARGEGQVCAAVSGEVAFHGVMLPTSALHQLLLDARAAPLVVTSGNLSGEPLCRTSAEALARLAGVADSFLMHDLELVRTLDDSVLRIAAGQALLLRRARGFAPRTLQLTAAVPDALASGAHFKNTLAVARGASVLVSPHIGDLDGPLLRERHAQLLAELPAWLGARPQWIARDAHPDYASSASAEAWTKAHARPRIDVQHHLAHVCAVMAEHGLEGPLLGVAWDGSGLGSDGTIWGGEFFRIEGARAERVAQLRPFSLIGGDRAAREPRRSGLSLLLTGQDGELARDPAGDAALARLGFEPDVLENLRKLSASKTGSVPCTSVGRLFDGVAALLGLCSIARFEAHAALALEAAARAPMGTEPTPRVALLTNARALQIDWWPMLHDLLVALHAGSSVAELAHAFHRWLAESIVAVAERFGLGTCVLAGGCFQNVCLVELAGSRLGSAGRRVHTAREYPANDGALALGQLFAAARGIELV